MRIDVSFDPGWYYGDQKHMLCVRKFLDHVEKESASVNVILQSSMICQVEIESDKAPEEIYARLNDYLSGTICADARPGSKPYTLSVDKLTAAEPAQQEAPGGVPAAGAPARPAKAEAMDGIEAMIGAGPFKALCRRLHEDAPRILREGTAPLFRRTAYLFASAEGTGADEALPLFESLLREEGLLDGDGGPHRMKVTYSDEQGVELEGGSISPVYAKPRVVLIDLRAAAEHTNLPAFKAILLEIFRKNDKCVTVFSMHYASRAQRESVREDIQDVLPVTMVEFPPLTAAEMRALAQRELDRYSFEAEEEAWPLFQEKLEQESRDGYFYGAETVRKVAGEMILAAQRIAGEEEPARRVTAEAVRSLLPKTELPEDGMSGLEALDAMVGMKAVANSVRELIQSVIFAKADPKNPTPAMHMVFTGNPGTGKTTVARILGRAFKEAGLLRSGRFIEHQGRDLVGRYVGHTAPKTHQICESAYGSVLFLDEAYSLFSGREGDTNDFGFEAVAQLIAEMENHRDDMVVILAGYPGEMDRFLNMNPGLRSRVPYHLEFPNYTREDLFAIFRQMLDSRFAYDEAVLPMAEEYFLSLPEEVLSSRTFGNGRFVRNLYEKLWSRAAMRAGAVSPDELVIAPEDLESLLAELPKPKVEEKRRVGF